MYCRALTKTGKRCARAAVDGSEFCPGHQEYLGDLAPETTTEVSPVEPEPVAETIREPVPEPAPISVFDSGLREIPLPPPLPTVKKFSREDIRRMGYREYLKRNSRSPKAKGL